MKAEAVKPATRVCHVNGRKKSSQPANANSRVFYALLASKFHLINWWLMTRHNLISAHVSSESLFVNILENSIEAQLFSTQVFSFLQCQLY